MCVGLDENFENNMWQILKMHYLPKSNYKFDPWFGILHDTNSHLALAIIEIASLYLRDIKANQKWHEGYEI